ncbi:MAG: hypothetical protein ACLFQZ_09010 [Spirochaetaceae bacterium]
MGTRKRNRRAIVLVHGLLITALIVALGACSTDGADPIAVEGTWVLDTGYYERWIITENSITYEGSSDGSEYTTNYEAQIVSYSNHGLNARETDITAGVDATGRNPGFAVIKFTEVANQGWGTVGKYTVFRWADNAGDPSKKDLTQGYKDATPNDDENFDTVVFDTPAEAEAEVTVANEFFENPPSSGAVKQ